MYKYDTIDNNYVEGICIDLVISLALGPSHGVSDCMETHGHGFTTAVTFIIAYDYCALS